MSTTLDEILELARDVGQYAASPAARALAAAVQDMLGEAFPCGFTMPEARGADHTRYVHAEQFEGEPNEARAYAAAILRAADVANAADAG